MLAKFSYTLTMGKSSDSKLLHSCIILYILAKECMAIGSSPIVNLRNITMASNKYCAQWILNYTGIILWVNYSQQLDVILMQKQLQQYHKQNRLPDVHKINEL